MRLGSTGVVTGWYRFSIISNSAWPIPNSLFSLEIVVWNLLAHLISMGDEGDRKRERKREYLGISQRQSGGIWGIPRPTHPLGKSNIREFWMKISAASFFFPRIFFIFCRVLNLRNCLRLLLCYMARRPHHPPTQAGSMHSTSREDDSLGQKRKKKSATYSSGQGKKVRVSPKLHVDFANVKNKSCQKKESQLTFLWQLYFFWGGVNKYQFPYF